MNSLMPLCIHHIAMPHAAADDLHVTMWASLMYKSTAKSSHAHCKVSCMHASRVDPVLALLQLVLSCSALTTSGHQANIPMFVTISMLLHACCICKLAGQSER